MPGKKFFLLISILLFLSFVTFSYLVAKESFTQFDFDTTVKFQDHISRRWDLPFSTLSVIGSAEITTLIWVGLFILALVRRYWLTLITLFLFFASVAIEIYGKLFVLHPAPPHLLYRGVIEYNFPSHFVQTNYSYPSGHVTRTAFLIAFLLVFFHLKSPFAFRIWPQLFLMGFLVAMMISRIYLGEHWTTDVIGGLLLGSSMGILSGITIPLRKKLIKKIQDDKTSMNIVGDS